MISGSKPFTLAMMNEARFSKFLSKNEPHLILKNLNETNSKNLQTHFEYDKTKNCDKDSADKTVGAFSPAFAVLDALQFAILNTAAGERYTGFVGAVYTGVFCKTFRYELFYNKSELGVLDFGEFGYFYI